MFELRCVETHPTKLRSQDLAEAFGGGDALAGVDAVVAAEEVGESGGQSEPGSVSGSKEFDPHEGAGDGGVGSSGKEGDEAKSGEEVDGCSAKSGNRIPEGGSDEEEGGDFASLKAGRKGDDGEEELPEPTEVTCSAGVEGIDDGDTCGSVRRLDAEAEVITRAEKPDEKYHEGSSNEGTSPGEGEIFAKDLMEGVAGGGEELSEPSAKDPQQDNLPEQQEGMRSGSDEERGVVGVSDAPDVTTPVSDQAADEAGDEGFVANLADVEDLRGEDRTGQGCAEDPSEPGGDANHQEDAGVEGIESEEAGETTGETAAHLDGGSFTSGRTPSKVGEDGADQDQGSHPEGDASTGFVDFIDEEIVAALTSCSQEIVESDDRDPDEREEVEEPRVVPLGTGSKIEEPEEESAGGPDQEGDREGQESPAENGESLCMVGAEGVFQSHRERSTSEELEKSGEDLELNRILRYGLKVERDSV